LAAPLSTAQIAALPKGIVPGNAIAATVSDNWSWQIDGSYTYRAIRFSIPQSADVSTSRSLRGRLPEPATF
jgi:hypothetical protein